MNARVLEVRTVNGHPCERHYSGIAPGWFWVRQTEERDPFQNGHGMTPDEAIADYLAKERLAA